MSYGTAFKQPQAMNSNRTILCGAAVAAVFVLSISQLPQLTNLVFAPTTSRPLTAIAPQGIVRAAPSRMATSLMSAPEDPVIVSGDETGFTGNTSPVTLGLVATISTVLGALAMKLWNQRDEAATFDVEANAAGATTLSFNTMSPFTGSRLNVPDFSRDARGSRLVLQAAKAGKGKGGGGGKGKIAGIIKLALPAGKATPAPPVGPALGQYGLNIVQFCKEYNAATEKEAADGMIIPVEITAFEDRSYKFILKTPPASVLLRKAAGAPKGSSVPHKDKVGSITKAQLEEIAKTKLPDLNTPNVEQAMKIVAGTARSMGITIN